MQQARKSIACLATNAGAERHVLLVHHDSARSGKRMVPRGLQVLRELLNTRLVRYWRIRIACAARWFGGVNAPKSMHVIHLFSFGVVRFHLVIADWPRRGDTVIMLELAKVFFAETVESGTVHLGCPTHEVVDLWLKSFAGLVIPRILRDIAVLDEDCCRIPVLCFARQPVTALKDQDALARRGKVTRQRAPACTAADNDQVIVGIHH